jgi:hypothetical protein
MTSALVQALPSSAVMPPNAVLDVPAAPLVLLAVAGALAAAAGIIVQRALAARAMPCAPSLRLVANVLPSARHAAGAPARIFFS